MVEAVCWLMDRRCTVADDDIAIGSVADRQNRNPISRASGPFLTLNGNELRGARQRLGALVCYIVALQLLSPRRDGLFLSRAMHKL